MRARASALGLDTLVEAHDAEELDARRRARRRRDRRQRARPLDVRDRPPRAARARSRGRRATASSIAESGDRDARAGAPPPSSPARTRSSSARRSCARPTRRRSCASSLSRPLVKVCGLTRQEDVDAAVEAGADLVGFILARESPRRARRRARRARHGARASPSSSARRDDTDADLVQLYAPRERPPRARRALLLRRRRRSRRVVDLPWAGRRPDAPRARRARPTGRVMLAGGLGARRTCATAIARRAPVGRRLGALDRARRPASRITTRVRAWVEARAMTPHRSATYGGRYVPETLIPALDELEAGWRAALATTTASARELHELLHDLRRPPDAAHAAPSGSRPSKRLYLKREDLLHTGAHKLNNALGQAVLARRLGKRRIVAETGAGQHGVATATVCARFGLECVVYMGAEDMRRQRPNVERMRPARRRGAPGRVRHAHAEGGDERGDPRLDHERRDDALPDRLVRRARAVPGARARAAGA